MNENGQEDGSAYHLDHHRVLGWWYVLEGRRTEATGLDTNVHAHHSHALTVPGTWHPPFHDLSLPLFIFSPLVNALGFTVTDPRHFPFSRSLTVTPGLPVRGPRRRG